MSLIGRAIEAKRLQSTKTRQREMRWTSSVSGSEPQLQPQWLFDLLKYFNLSGFFVSKWS